jgi:hypothetical protein
MSTIKVETVESANDVSGTLRFNVNLTERARIDSNGNMGVGTALPSYRFHVSSAAVNALGVYRDADVNSVGAAGQIIDIGARIGGTFVPGVTLSGVLENATLGSFTISTRASGGMTPRLTVNSSGNIQIGTTSSAESRVFIYDAKSTGSATFDTAVYVRQDGTNHIQTWAGASGAERMRLSSSGVLTLGPRASGGETASSGTGFGFNSAADNPFFTVVNTSAAGANACAYLNKRMTGAVIAFITNNGTSDSPVGTISHNGSATSYNTTSDGRLKEQVEPIVGALESVCKLRPVTYSWKNTGIKDDGFIAQEVIAIPEFADRVSAIGKAEDGSDLLGVDYMKFTAMLTAAIQELKAELDACKAEIAALKGQ